MLLDSLDPLLEPRIYVITNNMRLYVGSVVSLEKETFDTGLNEASVMNVTTNKMLVDAGKQQR